MRDGEGAGIGSAPRRCTWWRGLPWSRSRRSAVRQLPRGSARPPPPPGPSRGSGSWPPPPGPPPPPSESSSSRRRKNHTSHTTRRPTSSTRKPIMKIQPSVLIRLPQPRAGPSLAMVPREGSLASPGRLLLLLGRGLRGCDPGIRDESDRVHQTRRLVNAAVGGKLPARDLGGLLLYIVA